MPRTAMWLVRPRCSAPNSEGQSRRAFSRTPEKKSCGLHPACRPAGRRRAELVRIAEVTRQPRHGDPRASEVSSAASVFSGKQVGSCGCAATHELRLDDVTLNRHQRLYPERREHTRGSLATCSASKRNHQSHRDEAGNPSTRAHAVDSAPRWTSKSR